MSVGGPGPLSSRGIKPPSLEVENPYVHPTIQMKPRGAVIVQKSSNENSLKNSAISKAEGEWIGVEDGRVAADNSLLKLSRAEEALQTTSFQLPAPPQIAGASTYLRNYDSVMSFPDARDYGTFQGPVKIKDKADA